MRAIVRCEVVRGDGHRSDHNRIYNGIVLESNPTLQYGAGGSVVREVSPVEIAGQMSTFYVVLFRCGFLGAYLLGIGLPSAKAKIDFAANHYWRFMLAFPLVTMTLQTVLLFLLYNSETPKYLYLNGHKQESRALLHKLYTTEEKINEVEDKLAALLENTSTQVSWKELFGRVYLKALFVVFGNSRHG